MQRKIKQFPLVAMLSFILALTACASTSLMSLPTEQYVAKHRTHKHDAFSFNSTESKDKLYSQLEELSRECVPTEQTSSGTAVVGAGIYAPVSVTIHYRMDAGSNETNGHWLALRNDSPLVHGIRMAVEITPIESGSSVIVYNVNKNKADLIKQLVESGGLFCRWQDVIDPWG